MLRSTKIAAKASTIALAAVAAFFSLGVAAAPIIFTGSGTNGTVVLSAEATFDIVGGQLAVTLQNTAPNNPGLDVPSSGLGAVFFNLPDAIILTPVSATIIAGQIIQGSTCDILNPPGNGDNAANCTAAQTNVGGEFGYATGASNLPPGSPLSDRGISSSGFSYFANGNFGGPNLDNPDALNGMNFLLISANETSFSPNGGMADEPLIQGTVRFLLNISGGTLALDQIDHVYFQYGTAYTEPGFPGDKREPPQQIPEPATMLMFGMGLLALAATRRRGLAR
jgi:hypothetical protein